MEEGVGGSLQGLGVETFQSMGLGVETVRSMGLGVEATDRQRCDCVRHGERKRPELAYVGVALESQEPRFFHFERSKLLKCSVLRGNIIIQ